MLVFANTEDARVEQRHFARQSQRSAFYNSNAEVLYTIIQGQQMLQIVLCFFLGKHEVQLRKDNGGMLHCCLSIQAGIVRVIERSSAVSLL